VGEEVSPEELGAHVCEVEVLDCATTRSHYGPWVKLRFQSPEQAALFRKGQRLQIAAALMHDVEPGEPQRKPIEQRKPYKASQLCGMLCCDPLWWRWIHDEYDVLCSSPEDAAQWVREVCAVSSRSLLDTERVPRETFLRLLAEWDEWKGIE
jgi:hypothetical protein